MATWIFVFLGLLSLTRGDKDNSKIVGGSDATRGQFPYQVSLQTAGFRIHFCGGTIYSAKAVVTAAHCCEAVQNIKIVVVAGGLALDRTSGDEQVVEVESMILHPEYRTLGVGGAPVNDLCVLVLDGSLTFDDVVRPLKIDVNGTCRANDKCLISGWGVRSEGSQVASDDLLYAEINLLPDSSCQPYSDLGMYDPRVMTCAGDPTFSKDTCQGDSGGPLQCRDLLCGIVSFGYGCAQRPYHGVYTEVSPFADWILKNGSPLVYSRYQLLITLVTAVGLKKLLY